ncbi:MAG: hypothetical protein H7A19_04370 [Rhodanobacteraceae bacterium]|nr:hypothetical protein [Rhodanobacteraceae bacterium]
MKMRTILIAAAITAVLAPTLSIAKSQTLGRGVHGNARAGAPDGVATSNFIVDLSGISTDALCGDAATPGAGSTVVSVNLGKNAVVTGIGGVGSYESFSPSWRSEVSAIFRGNDPLQSIQLAFSNDDSSGVANYNIPIIDLTGQALSNINTGNAGVLNIELCETFADADVSPDATFAAGANLQIAYYVPAVPAPAMSTWSMLALLLGFGLVGGLAVRRFS